MIFEEARSFLFELPRFASRGSEAYHPGLRRIKALLKAFGHPEREYPSILVAGSNGKGSTASMLSAIFTAAGNRTGLHTSPHLLYVGERMRVNGIPSSREWLASRVSEYETVIRDNFASFFEATLGLSLLYFAEEAVDVAVVEVGLGGRLDASNALAAELSIITGVSFEHTEILGDRLEDIAREKAGIVKRRTPVLTGFSEAAVLDVIRSRAEEMNAPFHALDEEIDLQNDGGFRTPDNRWDRLDVELSGAHQYRNALLALRSAELCRDQFALSEEAIRKGLAETMRLSGLRGRMEVIHDSPSVIVDVAHNVESLDATLAEVRKRFVPGILVLIGLMKDKNIAAMGRVLARDDIRIVTVDLDFDRAMTAQELARRFIAEGVRVEYEASSVGEALDTACSLDGDGFQILVTGSHLAVADAILWENRRH